MAIFPVLMVTMISIIELSDARSCAFQTTELKITTKDCRGEIIVISVDYLIVVRMFRDFFTT